MQKLHFGLYCGRDGSTQLYQRESQSDSERDGYIHIVKSERTIKSLTVKLSEKGLLERKWGGASRLLASQYRAIE